MKKTILFISLFLISNIMFAQNKEEAEKLVDEGIVYHDKGNYEKAISIYNNALKLDKDNYVALAEKAFSLLSLKNFEKSIMCCKTAIEKHPMEENLGYIYVIYGNALDGLQKSNEAIEKYDKGIMLSPYYYQLHFNKGITLASLNKYNEAILSFQKSIVLNPKHASSHNALAILLNFQNQKIPSILAYCRFLVIEPKGNRAERNLPILQKILTGNIKETGKKTVTININADMLGDTTEDGKNKENNFASTELILALVAGVGTKKKKKKKSQVEQFILQFDLICSSLKNSQKDNSGFYWNYYVPYFIELQDKDFIKTFAYIVFASSNDSKITKWIKSHEIDIEKFYNWSESYSW